MQTSRKQEKLRRALTLERTRVRTRLAANWRQVQALADEIETATAAGQPHARQLAELDQLGRRATQLAAAGAAIDRQLSELPSMDQSRSGRRWRPTAAEPF
jgi:hypothetical protein